VADLPSPGTGREPATLDRHAAAGAPALNRDEALELLTQLEAALRELRGVRTQSERR